MVKIRLMRVGKKKQPSYRVVVADSRSPRDGRIIEAIGHYNPRLEPSVIEIDNERALHWLRVGAQPSDQARKLLQISGAWTEFTGAAPAAAVPRPTAVKATAAASVTEVAAEPTESAEATGPTEPTESEPVTAPQPEAVEAETAAPAEPAAKAVGWNWTNSTSVRRAPTRAAMARPSPVASRGFVVWR